MSKFCPNCGAIINDDTANNCVVCGNLLIDDIQPKIYSFKVSDSVQDNTSTLSSYGKSKLVAIVLALFLGIYGVHNFYLGYNKKAIIQLLITFLTLGVGSIISGIWAIIDIILILRGSIDKDAKGVVLSK